MKRLVSASGRRSARRGLASWGAAAAACAAAGLLAELVGLPAPWLLGGLLGGLAVALARGRMLEVPRAATVASQAAVGVAIGAAVVPGSLGGLGAVWSIVAATVGLTLALSVGVALLLARTSALDQVTATIGMLPGAAPALIAVGEEVGADARLVATMQYGRVLLVVASVPALALALGAGAGTPGGGDSPSAAPSGTEPVLVAFGLAVAGAALAALARAPAGSLVGPLVLSALVTVTGLLPVAVPAVVADAAFVVVGASVGLQFDRAAIRHAGRLAPYMGAAILVLTAACAAPAVLLVQALDTDLLTAYLATTPGGISSVLAAAFDSGADLTIVVAVQTLRLLVLALVAPFAARLLRVRAPG